MSRPRVVEAEEAKAPREALSFSSASLSSLYNLPVRAAAIAHSYVKANVVESFCDARVSVFRGNTLESGDLPDVAMVFGGDGTVHRVLRSLAHSQTPLLIVPMGSANDFAKCLGISSYLGALRAWRRYLDRGDNVRTIDLGVVRPIANPVAEESEHLGSQTFTDAEGRIPRPSTPIGPVIMRYHLRRAEGSAEDQRMIYFGGIAGIGLDAETNRLANLMPGWLRRHGGYVLAALRGLAHYAAPALQLHSFDAAGQETCLTGPVLFVAVGNSPQYGSGIRMLPQAQVDDGQLDLCYVPAMPKRSVLFYFHKIYSGTHVLVPRVRYFRTNQVFLETADPMPIYADGEYLCQTPAEVSVCPKALRVIVP